MKLMKLTLSTSEGVFAASYSGRGLCALDFPTGKAPKTATPAKPRSSRGDEAHSPETAKILRWHAQTEQAINSVLAGEPVRELPPLDLSAGTSFQQAVWKVLRSIPTGRTLSYGEVARKIGKPGAARAVGAACGANPIPLLVPCHRVLAANGKLGGFSGGLDWKRKLLAREKVNVT
jgi:O-6-methylguanine DNA methyltransferase